MDKASSERFSELLSMVSEKNGSFFTDLDLTACNINREDYAEKNGNPNYYMQPDIRKSYEALRPLGEEVYIVTGRHWSGLKENDVTGEKHPDGALYDLLGGEKSEFADCKVIAGHGRTIIRNGKAETLSRSPEKAVEERRFAKYVGRRVLEFKKDLFKKYPEMRGVILAEFKPHLSYVNVYDYTKTLDDPEKVKEINSYVKKQMKNICEGKRPDGSRDKNAPENPDNVFAYVGEPTGSMEIRPTNWTKRKGIEKSGFMEEALERGGPVIVMGDSLGKGGTDRDLFAAANEFFTKHNAKDRLFLVQVENNVEGQKPKRITDKNDECYPDIVVSSPDELGEMLLKTVPHAKQREAAKTIKQIKEKSDSSVKDTASLVLAKKTAKNR